MSNNEKYKIRLAEYTILEFSLFFQGQKNFTDRTKEVQFEEVTGSLDAFMAVLAVSDEYVFNNLPYF